MKEKNINSTILKYWKDLLDNDDKKRFQLWLETNPNQIRFFVKASKEKLVANCALLFFMVEQEEKIDSLEDEVESLTKKCEQLEWKTVQKKQNEKAKEKARAKKTQLRKTIVNIMGANSGLEAWRIVKQIAAKCKFEGVKTPYSIKLGKNGKSSLLRKVEELMPSIREELRNRPAPKSQA